MPDAPGQSVAFKRQRYSVPRRFDLATMLVVTAAYSLLFAGMKLANFGIAAFIIVAGLFTLVAIAQSLFASWSIPRRFLFLFRNDPRQIFVLVGILYYVVLDGLFGFGYFWRLVQSGYTLKQLGVALLILLLPGTLIGYVSGVLVGGVFLAADKLRKLFKSPRASHGADQPTDNDSPWDK